MVHQNGKPGKPRETDLKLVQHGKQLRATITIPLVVGDDSDLINHINNLPPEQRQKAIKNAVRGGIGYLDPAPEPPVDRSNEILERLDWLVENLSWLIDEFRKLPSWLEDKLKRLRIQTSQQAVIEDIVEESPMSVEQEEELKKNLKKRKW